MKDDSPFVFAGLWEGWKDPANGEWLHTEAIRLNPGDASAYQNRGIAYHKKGDYNKAMNDFSEAIGLKPDDADAYNNRGIIYKSQGKLDKAKSRFQ